MKVVITSAKRTLIGILNRGLSSLSVSKLGRIAIKDVLDDTGINLSIIDEVILGNVLTAGIDQAPCRQEYMQIFQTKLNVLLSVLHQKGRSG